VAGAMAIRPQKLTFVRDASHLNVDNLAKTLGWP
jgi:hypothetical protein